jgi:hypothetical protein
MPKIHQTAANGRQCKPVPGLPVPGERGAPVTVRVSLLVPAGRRTRWWYLATCSICRAPHLGRARELADVTGKRRLPCGHWVDIVVARTYGQIESKAAA